MSIQDERAALESIACSSSLNMDARLDALCEQCNPIQDILLVIGHLKPACSQDAYLSCLRLLLEKRKGRLDRGCVLKLLLAEAIPKCEPLLHPIIASIVADHTLLPCLVPLLRECDDVPIKFLFSVDADALIVEGGMLGWARAVLAKRFAASNARQYINECIVGKQISVESVLALCEYIEDWVAVMLALSSNMQPLLPDLMPGQCDVSNALLALLLHVSLYGFIDDYLLLLSSVKSSTPTFEAIKCLSMFVMSTRYPNDARIDCTKCVLPNSLSFDPHQLQLKKHLDREDQGFNFLLTLLELLSGGGGEEINLATNNSLLIEVMLKCLVACISAGKKNREWCINQLASLSRHSQTIAESVVLIAEMLSNKFPELQYPILSAMAANSNSLPILQFILSRMESAYQSDVEQFFKLAKFLLDNPNVRQSTLDFIACRLKEDSSSFSTPLLIAGCLEVWRVLAQLHYISPDCIYLEIVMKNNWPQSNDPLITTAFIDFCSTFALLPCEVVDEEVKFQPIVMDALKQVVVHLSYDHKYLDGIGAIKHTQHSKKKVVIEAVFRCLSKYESFLVLSFLDEQRIKFEALMAVLSKYECTECTPQMKTVLSWYLSREIKDMSRSLFLGTFDGRIHVPHVIGGLLGALLTLPNIKDINLANFEVYPWFVKMEFVAALSKYYKNLLNGSCVEDVVSILNSLDNTKESILLWSFSMASLLASGLDVKVDQSRMERLKSIANEDAQFALECLSTVLNAHSATVDSMPKAMACSMFGSSTNIANLPKRLQLPFAYMDKQINETAIDALLSEEDYYSYLIGLISHKTPLTDDQVKAIQRKSTSMAIKEPLDMQGTLAFFSCRLTKHPVDLSVNMNAIPVVRQIQMASAACAVASSVDASVDKLISAAAKAKKLLPFVDLLIYNKYRPSDDNQASSSPGSDTNSLLGSIERFPDGSVFKSLVLTALPTIPDVALNVLSASPSIPVLDWLEHLTSQQAVYSQPSLISFICKHLYCDAGSTKRLNQSIVGSVEFLFRCDLVNFDWEPLLSALPQDARNVCTSIVKDRKLNLNQLLALIKYSSDDRLIDCLLDNNELLDTEDVVDLLKELLLSKKKVSNVHWSHGLEMLRAAQRGLLADYVNSVDCSSHPTLLASLFRQYPSSSSKASQIINKQLREQIESILS